MHYCKDGSLDMRYSSSKEAYAAGLCDSHGYGYSNSSSSASTCSPSYSLSTVSSPAPSYDSGIYGDYSSDSGFCLNASSSKYIEHTSKGMEKRGSLEDDTNACHILSYRVVNTAISHTPGRPYSDETKEQIQQELGKKYNLRIKSRDGNMYGYNGYTGDEALDKQIAECMDGTRDRLTSQLAVDRLIRQWEVIQKGDFPQGFKEAMREQMNKVRDQDGHVIIRSNASLSI